MVGCKAWGPPAASRGDADRFHEAAATDGGPPAAAAACKAGRAPDLCRRRRRRWEMPSQRHAPRRQGPGRRREPVTLVCCPATCRSCFQQARKACQGGDAHWSAKRCCGGDIVASRLYCSVTTQPPCIIGQCTSWRPYLPWPWPHVDQSDEPPPPTDFFKVLLVVPLAISQANFAEEVRLARSLALISDRELHSSTPQPPALLMTYLP